MTVELPTLVLLPGMDGTGDLFEPLVRALDRRIETVVVRYPVAEPLDYAGLLPIARAALPTDRRFVLVAESFSGPLGISLAAEAAPGLCGLVLCGSFVRNPRPALTRFARFVQALPINAATVRIATGAMLGRSAEHPLRALVERSVARIPGEVWRMRLRAVLRVDASDELAAVDVPILYLQASRDRAVPSSAATRICRIKPGARIVRIEGPHFLLQTNPQVAAAELIGFAKSASA